MKKNKALSVVLASTLVVSILVPYKCHSALEQEQAQKSKGFFGELFHNIANEVEVKFNEIVDAVTGNELLNIKLLDPSVVDIFDLDLVDGVLKDVGPEVETGLKELIAIWASQNYIMSPSSQLGIFTNARGQSEILDLAEKDLTFVENQIVNLLISLHGEGKMVPFISTLIETLKKDPKYGPYVSTIAPDRKLMLLSTVDTTIRSTAALRKFSNTSWTKLSKKFSAELNKIEQGQTKQTRLSDSYFFSELANIANSQFYPTENVRLLIDGPASFTLRDSAMAKATASINMITWAVVDDKTGQELADLLIKKAKDIPVRLIVDGQVSRGKGYRDQVERMEKNGVQVVRWYNPDATFMGQHRKILIIDGALTIMGGMNPGDTYSHKAGEPKTLWRDTDVAIEGETVQQTQNLFVTLWNKQIDQQKLSFKRLVNTKKAITKNSDGRAMIIEHQPSGAKDQHEIMLATMKAIRGAEKTIDIENAYVIVFPSLLNEIKSAVDRGVRVRVLTNSTDSVDEPVVALPILRSAKKLADIGAEVYMRKGSTIHSKFLIADQRLFMIGSYNYHPRSETLEGETVAAFDHPQLAQQATVAFEKDILPENASRLDKSVEIDLPINGSTLLPLRMFYDQL